MGTKVRIVTDSTVRFEETDLAEDLGITVVPVGIDFHDRSLKDGVEVTTEELIHRVRHEGATFRVSSPPASAFESIYTNLSKVTDQICVMVHSQWFTSAFAHARSARSAFLGRCDIMVIDSQTTSLGLGYLVEEVSRAALDGAELEETVRVARSVIPRVYSVYYVETLDHLRRAGLIGETQAILGRMLNIKPLLTIEDGKLIVMEKVRTHSQAIDKIVEFVSEFTHLERMGIIQNSDRVSDRTRMLQDRLALTFQRIQYPLALHDPVVLSLIGADGLGMVVLESAGGDEDLDIQS